MRVKTEAKREAILDVASEVFRELGFKRTSMDEIAARVGGSKGTLYGYFPSKQQLFIEVAMSTASRQLSPAFEELLPSHGTDLTRVLRRFGEKFLAFMYSPDIVGAYRMVLAQPVQTGIARNFFENGPKRGEAALGAFLQAEMEGGALKKADPLISAMHLLALLKAEAELSVLVGSAPTPTHLQLRDMVHRAVTVFMAAYAA